MRLIVLAAALIAIHAQAKEPTYLTGSGFFYNENGDFFTNKHVVAGCIASTLKARTADGSWHAVKLIALDSKADLAAGTIAKPVEAFASVRAHPDTGYVSVPESTEDVFSAGFSAPQQNNFKLQAKWGQIQPWRDPNKFPFVQRMRMDAYPGASGSPILDYAGLLVGILFAGSVDEAPDLKQMRRAGYGDKWIFAYNNNAIVDFANRHSLQYSSWDQWKRQDPIVIAQHASRISIFLICESKIGS
jgi:hypothetical protein